MGVLDGIVKKSHNYLGVLSSLNRPHKVFTLEERGVAQCEESNHQKMALSSAMPIS